MKNNGDNDSPKVTPEMANERKQQAAEFCPEDSCDENRNFESCEQMVKDVCEQLFSQYKVPAFHSKEDHINEVIVRFLPYIPEYRGDAEIRTLIYRIARNLLTDIFRKNGRSKTFSECQRDRDNGDNHDEDHFLDTLIRNREVNRNYVEEQEENFILLDGFLTQLTAKQQLICRQIEEGQSLTDIAEMLGVRPQAVSNTKSRINRRWRAYLEGPHQGGPQCARV